MTFVLKQKTWELQQQQQQQQKKKRTNKRDKNKKKIINSKTSEFMDYETILLLRRRVSFHFYLFGPNTVFIKTILWWQYGALFPLVEHWLYFKNY